MQQQPGTSAADRPRPLRPGMRLSQLLTVRDQTDTTGRLLLEDSAPEHARRKAHRAGIAMKTESCPYRDTPSRLGGTMNTSAYDALRRDLAEVLNGLAWIAASYLELDPARRSTVRALLDCSHLGVSLPLVLFYRSDEAVEPHGALPSYVASIFKACRGLFSAAVDLLNKQGPPERVVTAEEVVAFAEHEGHLVRPNTRRVCAAPTRLIERTIDVILTGEGADPSRSDLGTLVAFPTLWEFYTVEESFSEALSGYRLLLDNLMSTAQLADPAQLFETRILDEGRSRPFGEVTEEFLQRAEEVQASLNRILGRSTNAASVTFEDLLRLL
jgi:hypothetical protein